MGRIGRVWVAPGTAGSVWGDGSRPRPRGGRSPRATIVCLHTNAAVPGALAFWTGFPGAVLVHDARPDPWSTVHFEIDPTALDV